MQHIVVLAEIMKIIWLRCANVPIKYAEIVMLVGKKQNQEIIVQNVMSDNKNYFITKGVI